MSKITLSINIEELLRGQIVESDRLDYKEGFDPEKIAHTVCAFANDINNISGGYLVIGVESKDGVPKLPPAGLEKSQIEAFQKKIIEVQHKVEPFPQVVVSPENFEGKNILVIWVPGGENRPYKAPVSYTGKNKAYYIRRHSTTARANNTEERRLMESASRIPFDDRVNHSAGIDAVNREIIMSFLKETGSGLYSEAKSMNVEALCRAMQIARGPKENFRPVNAGLLMFSDDPEKYFPGARIEVVVFKNKDGSGEFSEKIFTGPLFRQLKDALAYIKNVVITERVQKIPGEAKADRFFNYPYQAIEEILANAVYHRSYELRDPVEFNVFPDRIEVVSKPGPVPPTDNKDLKKARVLAREYRNRRIGDFLKEIHLTEGRGTGFPEIRRVLKFNGSPAAEFKTDKNRMYFLAILKAHRSFMHSGKAAVPDLSQAGIMQGLSWDQVGTKSGLSRDEAVKILMFCETGKAATDIMALFNRQNKTKFKNKYIKPLLKLKLLNMTIPGKPNSSKQRYITTEKGRSVAK